MTRAITLLLLLAVAAPAAAQEREIRDANLPRALEARLLAMYDGGAARYDGPTTIAAHQVLRTDVAAMGGPLVIAGRVDGDVAVVGGDLVMEGGAVVTGNVTVVGGEVRMADDAVVAGSITAYGPTSAPRWVERDRPRRPVDRDERGYSRLTVRPGVSYNRVEGLPVMFGPIFETPGPAPLRVEALAIWRTEAGGSPGTNRMGYRVRAEQFLVPNAALSVGGSVFSVVDPMDRWQIRDLEASLAAVLFHQDYRDHFDRTGWNAFVGLRPVPGLDLRISYEDETHGALPIGDPWALFNRSSDWRLQPLVGEGRVRSVGASAELDRRDRRESPRSGWLARATVARPVGGSLVRPALDAVAPRPHPDFEEPVTGVIPATPLDLDFTIGHLDLRRYMPAGYRSTLNMRVVAGGSVTDTRLPPQYQHALGGPGTLPGFDAFRGDCGARRAAGVHDGHTYFAAYGCDRFALGQAEYRGRFSMDFGFGDWHHSARHRDWRFDSWDTTPTWAVFVNAGRGWAFADPVTGDPIQRTTGTMVDAGLGFLIGKLGIYAAVPLNSNEDQSPRFFLRWGPRF